MKELSQETKLLLNQAREQRLPSRSRLAQGGLDLEETLESLQSKPQAFDVRKVALVLVLVSLFITSSVVAFSILTNVADSTASSVIEQETMDRRREQPIKQEKRSGALRPGTEPAETQEKQVETSVDQTVETKASAPRKARRRHQTQEKAVRSQKTTFSDPSISQVTPESLIEETRLLNGARQALRNKRPSSAIPFLEEHQRRFPRGTLSLERNATLLVARCQINQTAGLKARAQQFVARYPGSIHTSRVQSSCLRTENF